MLRGGANGNGALYAGEAVKKAAQQVENQAQILRSQQQSSRVSLWCCLCGLFMRVVSGVYVAVYGYVYVDDVCAVCMVCE